MLLLIIFDCQKIKEKHSEFIESDPNFLTPVIAYNFTVSSKFMIDRKALIFSTIICSSPTTKGDEKGKIGEFVNGFR
jgi:hypothetical protein